MAVLTDNMRVLELSTFSTVVGGMPTQRELEWLCRRFLREYIDEKRGFHYVLLANNDVMEDQNMCDYVYITLSKINLINSYNEIYPTLEGKKGILYLDSGNHFEIKNKDETKTQTE